MASPPQSLTTLLARLAASGTDFLLVGGLAAVAQGAPLSTIDVDVVRLETLAELKRGAVDSKGRLTFAGTPAELISKFGSANLEQAFLACIGEPVAA